MRKYKFKLHFNRINMQRGNPNVWTVHTRGLCIQVERVEIQGVHLHTVFDKDGRQPRAFFTGFGYVYTQGSTAIIRG